MTREEALRQADAALAMILAEGDVEPVVVNETGDPDIDLGRAVKRARDRLADMIMAGEV